MLGVAVPVADRDIVLVPLRTAERVLLLLRVPVGDTLLVLVLVRVPVIVALELPLPRNETVSPGDALSAAVTEGLAVVDAVTLAERDTVTLAVDVPETVTVQLERAVTLTDPEKLDVRVLLGVALLQALTLGAAVHEPLRDGGGVPDPVRVMGVTVPDRLPVAVTLLLAEPEKLKLALSVRVSSAEVDAERVTDTVAVPDTLMRGLALPVPLRVGDTENVSTADQLALPLNDWLAVKLAVSRPVADGEPLADGVRAPTVRLTDGDSDSRGLRDGDPETVTLRLTDVLPLLLAVTVPDTLLRAEPDELPLNDGLGLELRDGEIVALGRGLRLASAE